MSVEIFGHLTHRNESEVHLASGPSLDVEYIKRQSREHEYAGFDGVLIGVGSDGPDSLQIAALAATETKTLRLLVANRPGLINPTWAARSYATLDRISNGRAAFHVITGRESDGTLKNGDPLAKENRYGRTKEFMQIIKQAWTQRQPFDFRGRHYDIQGFVASVFPIQEPRIPVFFAGNSDVAFEVGAAEADRYALYAQPIEFLKQDIAKIHAAAKASGRPDLPGIIIFVRLVVGATDELAWQKAEGLKQAAIAQSGSVKPSETRWLPSKDGRDASAGDRRQLEANGISERHDRALWTGLSGVTERGKSSALVGSPSTIVDALLDYVDAGVTTFILDGFNRLNDVPEFGQHIIPAFRAALAERGQWRKAV
ncbi:LLM class flavin-dependent oxidoreductase [Rhizobium lusitanum]|uniref:LLM class flavin-dependent oxidoreductase n=1 Tax=Rhizobium lusitanum TaxID=293958 RepID=A0A6L9UHF9_9HYPH|nr:LLM class flavin-dependent oxidoreductase [Rhizobium lusitanum]NEI73597.1 LLM class flavin-dependent oxidoreductase [Rhizobium lusitanum]